jgi:hypothetical protein
MEVNLMENQDTIVALIALVESRTRKTIVIGERPELALPDTFVFNAPRPLHGSEIPWGKRESGVWTEEHGNRNRLEWIGDFIQGVFFAAVSYDDPDARRLIAYNADLDATFLQYVDRETYRQETIEWAKQYLAAFNKRSRQQFDLPSLSLKQWDETRRNNSEHRIFGDWLVGEIE